MEVTPLSEAYTGNGVIVNSDFLNDLDIISAKAKAIKEVEKENYKENLISIKRLGCQGNDIGDAQYPYLFRRWKRSSRKELPILLPKDVDLNSKGNPLEAHDSWKYTVCKNR